MAGSRGKPVKNRGPASWPASRAGGTAGAAATAGRGYLPRALVPFVACIHARERGVRHSFATAFAMRANRQRAPVPGELVGLDQAAAPCTRLRHLEPAGLPLRRRALGDEIVAVRLETVRDRVRTCRAFILRDLDLIGLHLDHDLVRGMHHALEGTRSARLIRIALRGRRSTVLLATARRAAPAVSPAAEAAAAPATAAAHAPATASTRRTASRSARFAHHLHG